MEWPFVSIWMMSWTNQMDCRASRKLRAGEAGTLSQTRAISSSSSRLAGAALPACSRARAANRPANLIAAA